MKKKKIIAIVIILPIVVLFLMWFVNKQQNERQYAEDLAVRFDETMKASCPMLAITTTALYRRAEMWEQNATEAYKNYPHEYKEAFQYLNSQSSRTYQASRFFIDIETYKFFLSSASFDHLYHGGDLRKKESEAFCKILYAYQTPTDPLEIEYEELIAKLHKAKEALSESIEVLSKYKAGCGELNDWRHVSPMKYNYIFERYKSKKNWPFTFLNSKD